MNNQEILGMNSAYEHAKQCAYGANMSISAALVVDMAKRIAEIEKDIAFLQSCVNSGETASKADRPSNQAKALKEQGK